MVVAVFKENAKGDITTTAVMPKLITIAVSTKACGNGSVYSVAYLLRIGGRFTAKRPVENKNTFTAYDNIAMPKITGNARKRRIR